MTPQSHNDDELEKLAGSVRPRFTALSRSGFAPPEAPDAHPETTPSALPSLRWQTGNDKKRKVVNPRQSGLPRLVSIGHLLSDLPT